MKAKMLLAALFGVAIWSLSSFTAASWSSGACPQPHTGGAPCIETVVNGNTYHFNGDGGHAGSWHGLPAAEGGGDFEFQNSGVELLCASINPNCDVVLNGQLKKCQDSDGNWRLGVRVTGGNFSGSFWCNGQDLSGFPWYSADPASHDHDAGQCPFIDDCDNFLPYDPSASNYVGHFGEVTMSSLLGTHIDAAHVHNMIFTANNQGALPTANFHFADRAFFDCQGEWTCSIDGILYLDNADELNIY
ncbi:MAG: hypothetical protein AXW12_16370 [Thalassospira sp. Nap_22]|nr:MAG: hypothetical protein AXW12_16370 [Thalassospira sp. Nap_22]